MSMKPRLEENNVGIPNTATQPKKEDESYYEIPGTATCMHPETNKKLTPNAVTGPKTFGN